MAPVDSDRIKAAQVSAKSDPEKAEAQYQEILSKAPSATSDAAVREYETALVSLGELYRDEKSVFGSYILQGKPLTHYYAGSQMN